MLSLSSLELAVIVKELRQVATQALVKNVYQTGSKTYVLKLFKPGHRSAEICIVAGSALFYTFKPLPKPAKPSQHVVMLRRIIKGFKIADVAQKGAERIVEITFEQGGYSLVAELMPPGCIVLVRGGSIEWASETVETSSRTIKKGVEYKPPSERYSIHPDMPLNNLFNRLNPNSTIVSSLSRDIGLGSKYAEELLFRAEVDKKTRVSDLSEEQRKRIQEALLSLVEEVHTPRPVVYYLGSSATHSLVELKSLSGVSAQSMASFNEAVHAAYLHMLAEAEKKEKVAEKEKNLEQLSRQKSYREYTLDRLEAKKRCLEDIIERIKSAIQLLEDFWTNPEDNVSTIASVTGCKTSLKPDLLLVEKGEIQLTFRRGISPHKELGRLFEELKTIKRSISKLIEEIRELDSKIAEARAEIEAVQPSPVVVEPTVTRTKKTLREFVTSGGFKVLCGRDAKSNLALLKKHLSDKDLVFHADIVGSPVSILKDGVKASERDVEEAAQITACYSRAWREMFSNVSVYHVTAGQVSFTPPSGQYIPKGSFMVYGRKTYIVSELRLAAVHEKEDIVNVLPFLTASRLNKVVVEFRPGKTRAFEAAVKVFELLKIKPSKEAVEYLASQIPYGTCSVFYQDKLISR